MAGFRIEGNTSGNVAEVDAGNHILTNLGKDTDLAGYGVIMSENDPGAVTGSPYLRSPETSADFRLRTGIDTLMMSETFNYAAQNSGVFQQILTTMTVGYGTGFITLNNSALTTINTGALYRSWRTFPLYGAGVTYYEWNCILTQAPQANNTVEVGAGTPTTATIALAEGVVFRWDATGTLKGVLVNNGTETATAAMATPSENVVHEYVITVSLREVQFWIDDVLQAILPVSDAVGGPTAESSLPTFARVYNGGSAPSIAQQLRMSNVTVSLGDWSTDKPWSHQQAGAGLSSIQGAAGMTQGQTANYVNSTAPASATLANATAGYATFGGQWQFAAVAGAETDYALFAYLVPVSAVGVTGRQLYITAVSISAMNTGAAVATTPTVLQWALGIGASAVSLATAEGAAAKAPRRISLGLQSFAIADPIGEVAPQIVVDLGQAALVANAGEYVHVILRMPLGTATVSQVIRGMVAICGYWE